MIHLVTFASDDMSISAELCVKSGVKQGCSMADVNATWMLNRMTEFRTDWERLRGVGYWHWKPVIILKAMEERQDGDLIIYADAGLEFIEPVQTVIDKMDQDIWLFGNQHLHARWCKRDIVDAVWPLPIDRQSFVDAGIQMSTPSNLVAIDVDGIESLYSWARFSTQAQASVIFFRVNDYTRAFVKEWLDWCLFEGGRLIDDSPSRTPNHPEFIENRHDQAILTTMAYREGIKLHAWYVEYEGYTPVHLAEYPREFERPLYYHHRFRNSDWEARGIKAA